MRMSVWSGGSAARRAAVVCASVAAALLLACPCASTCAAAQAMAEGAAQAGPQAPHAAVGAAEVDALCREGLSLGERDLSVGAGEHLEVVVSSGHVWVFEGGPAAADGGEAGFADGDYRATGQTPLGTVDCWASFYGGVLSSLEFSGTYQGDAAVEAEVAAARDALFALGGSAAIFEGASDVAMEALYPLYSDCVSQASAAGAGLPQAAEAAPAVPRAPMDGTYGASFEGPSGEVVVEVLVEGHAVARVEVGGGEVFPAGGSGEAFSPELLGAGATSSQAAEAVEACLGQAANPACQSALRAYALSRALEGAMVADSAGSFDGGEGEDVAAGDAMPFTCATWVVLDEGGDAVFAVDYEPTYVAAWEAGGREVGPFEALGASLGWWGLAEAVSWLDLGSLGDAATVSPDGGQAVFRRSPTRPDGTPFYRAERVEPGAPGDRGTGPQAGSGAEVAPVPSPSPAPAQSVQQAPQAGSRWVVDSAAWDESVTVVDVEAWVEDVWVEDSPGWSEDVWGDVWVEDSPSWSETVQTGAYYVVSDGSVFYDEWGLQSYIREQACSGVVLSYQLKRVWETVWHDAEGHWESAVVGSVWHDAQGHWESVRHEARTHVEVVHHDEVGHWE